MIEEEFKDVVRHNFMLEQQEFSEEESKVHAKSQKNNPALRLGNTLKQRYRSSARWLNWKFLPGNSISWA